MIKLRARLVLLAAILSNAAAGVRTAVDVVDGFRNSIGQSMVQIKSTSMSYMMGFSKTPLPPELGQSIFPEGDSDEKPYHKVRLSPFYMSSTEVTNIQYEAFDPSHKALRGKFKGLSSGDDEAVVFVSWENATGFAAWLSEKEGRSYRLPTEAEWEYAARGGNSSTQYSVFWTGNEIPAEMQKLNSQDASYCKREAPPAIDLTVGQASPNSFGLYDTIGNVEEWCSDWYGGYQAEEQYEPQGPEEGLYKITRGGSHSTMMYYLRTANRAASLPDDTSWFIGFRIAMDLGTKPSSPSTVARQSSILLGARETNQPRDHTRRLLNELTKVDQGKRDDVDVQAAKASKITKGEQKKPIDIHTIRPPILRKFVNIPLPGTTKFPFLRHNHEPTIAACPNGDLLASWFSTHEEKGREVGIVSSRLRLSQGQNVSWSEAENLINVPDRCQCCTAFYMDEDTGMLYHFSAVSAAGTFNPISGIVMSSDDCGLTWTKPEIIWPEHAIGQQIVVTILKTSQGEVLVPCDHSGHDLFWMTGDESVIRRAPSDRIMDMAAWQADTTQHTGIHHSAIVELRNSSILAVGRGHEVNGAFAIAVSNDGGRTFKSHGSRFPGIRGGQRPVILRLGEMGQPLLLCLFANQPMPIQHAGPGSFNITGLYCALSFDDGNTWPHIRPITDDLTAEGHLVETTDQKSGWMRYNSSEPSGYLAACVGKQDGMINIITSKNHYTFSAGWLMQLPPPPPNPSNI